MIGPVAGAVWCFAKLSLVPVTDETVRSKKRLFLRRLGDAHIWDAETDGLDRSDYGRHDATPASLLARATTSRKCSVCSARPSWLTGS